MNKPMEKMTVKPYGEDYMTGMFLDLVSFAFTQENHRAKFREDTGIDITNIVKATGITAMIDKATGYQETVIANWLDWVTKNLWGEEE